MTDLKTAMKKYLRWDERRHLPKSFDVIGDIAIFNDFPAQLVEKQGLIGKTLLNINNNIKVVAKKIGHHKGKYRRQKLYIIAGQKRKSTTHKENGVFLKLDAEKCYFSPRLSAERLRIAKLVKKDESVLVLFSGAAPYQCVIGKNAKPKEQYGVEMNPIAHQYALENIKLNKLTNVTLLRGDVAKVLPELRKRFDRVIMPLPKDATKFLDMAYKKLKDDGVIHLYMFAKEEEFKGIIARYKKAFKSVKLVKAGVYSPGVARICLDLKK